MTKQVRESSGVIPFRHTSAGLEVLVVKKSNGQGWTFPKGGVEIDLNDRQNAIKEAYEEAGVLGTITNYLGRYSYTKGGVKQVVRLFSMEVAVELVQYPEDDIRSRQWLLLKSAESILSKDQAKLLMELHRQFYS